MSENIEIFPHGREVFSLNGKELHVWGPISQHVIFGDYESYTVIQPPGRDEAVQKMSNRERQARNKALRAAKNV